jgi:hypothetical protein
MHATLEGVMKQMLNLWFDSKNHQRPFYLSNSINIDKILLNTKFPSEFPRTQRSISTYYVYKANEMRNLLFYSLIYVLKDKLKKDYFDHLILFILFIRILTKDKINDTDIRVSMFLIENFIKKFEILYGIENMSYNLHSHLHLSEQCFNFGPLNKLSCFAFEGFYNCCLDHTFEPRF